MFKVSRLIIAAFCSLSAALAHAQEGYVSDSVYTYLHTGPSAKFRIIGSINAGSPITIGEKSEDNKYTKVTDAKGREGWIMSEFVSTTQSIQQRYIALESQLNAQITSNQDLSQETSTIKQQTTELREQVTRLNQELSQAKADIIHAQSQLKGEDAAIKVQWLTRGGILVFSAFFIGVIVSLLIFRKKKRTSW